MSKPAQLLWKIARILLIVYAVLCLVLVFAQSHMLYFPQPVIESTPEDYNAQYEQVWIPGADNSKLYAWWLPSQDPAAPTLIYFHGNYGNVGSNAEQASRLARTCCNVLLFDYRGYGRSAGPFPSEKRIYADAEAAYNYAVTQKKVSPNHIVFYGHSLGGGVAFEMAKRHGDAAGLIAESTFTSVADRAALDPLYRFFPVRLLVHQRFDSIHKIAAIHMPMLVIAGTGDTTIPYAMSEQLYRSAPPNSELLLIPGAGHDNPAVVGGAKYIEAVKRFVSRVPAQQLSSR
ncbi:Alpha/beta hydrolase [Candidatus Koribacter versatilis Ellin345]|uniref:Alpha/beta hydrolase n=1 Tax=Koribacter versatilis (strain Ellin345) TaxID=204669 RepID=Q1IUN6_KORVE|nr:alpha/beta hydrolase [Candidatus Koribacter versatilis]ABF39414.1 Alpha/beta hydrolase [Candidatus Koribacter versatilis Ellin345]